MDDSSAEFTTPWWMRLLFEHEIEQQSQFITKTTTKTLKKLGKNQPLEHIGEKYKRDWPQLAPYYSTASAESDIRRTLYWWLYKEKLSAAGYINICCDNANPQYWKRSEIATGTYVKRYNNGSRCSGYFMERSHFSTFYRISMLFSRIFCTVIAFGNRQMFFFFFLFWAIKSMNRMFSTSSYCTKFTQNTRSIH